LDGLGIVQVAEMLLTEDVAAGRLVKLLPDYQSPSRPMHLVDLPDRRPATKLRAFIEFARNRFSLAQASSPSMLPSHLNGKAGAA
jgi:DNA-binding transcriptional LysR family regulator